MAGNSKYKTALIGYGYVGKAYHKMFPDAVIYDPFYEQHSNTQKQVNKCNLAIICVPTNPLPDGGLDVGIVEDAIAWLKTDLILIKSALMPGTTDKLIKKYKKRIVCSPEYIGEGGYWLPPWLYPDPHNPTKHRFIIVGGEPKDRSEVANFLWARMSPDIHIHQTTALEAELIKMVENTWGGMKVTFANEVFEICQAMGKKFNQYCDFTQVIKGWGLDSRVDAMHTRTMPGKRGFKSKCYDKDLPALVKAAKDAGYSADLFAEVLKSNQKYLNENKS